MRCFHFSMVCVFQNPMTPGPHLRHFLLFALRNVSKSTPKQLGATRKFEGFAQPLWPPKEISQNCAACWEKKSGVEKQRYHSSCVFLRMRFSEKKATHRKKNTMFNERLTPLKFKMEPENDCSQKESPFPGVDFQLPC